VPAGQVKVLVGSSSGYVNTSRHLALKNLDRFVGRHGPEWQQYCVVLYTVHGLWQPPGVFSWLGHCPAISAVHLMGRVHPFVVGLNSIGTLNPSRTEMS
jgi:hypothetical protein